MASERNTLDIANNPDLLRLVEEMRRHNTTTVLRNGDEDLVVVIPIREERKQKRTRHMKTPADHAAFVQAAGSLQGLVDAEEFKSYIAERRKTKNRPLRSIID